MNRYSSKYTLQSDIYENVSSSGSGIVVISAGHFQTFTFNVGEFVISCNYAPSGKFPNGTLFGTVSSKFTTDIGYSKEYSFWGTASGSVSDTSFDLTVTSASGTLSISGALANPKRVESVDPNEGVHLTSGSEYTPSEFQLNIFNNLRQWAVLKGVSKLPDESPASFWSRVEDASANPADSSYVGLINGILRDLGLSRWLGLTIHEGYQAPKKVVRLTHGFCYVLSWWSLDVEDSLNIRYSTIGELVEFLQDNGLGVTVHCDEALPAYLLLKGSNLTTAIESIPDQNVVELKPDILPGSIKLSSSAFWQMVNETPQNPGEYRIDYEKGIIEFFETPVGVSVAYQYLKFPWTVYGADVDVAPIGDPDYIAAHMTSTGIRPEFLRQLKELLEVDKRLWQT